MESNNDLEAVAVANGHPPFNHEPSSVVSDGSININTENPLAAKRKVDDDLNGGSEHTPKRRKGTAPIKE